MIRVFFACCILAAPVYAENLCDVADPDAVITSLAGQWDRVGALSVESEILSGTNAVEGTVILSETGLFAAEETLALGGAVQMVPADQRVDVDRVDDLLDTAEVPWIADAVSETRCGPESLPQFSADLKTGALDGQITLIAYFSDRIVMLTEFQAKGEWGLAFVTSASLLRPAAPEPASD